ncbi:MAG: sigma-70 family RNA polymerase sigma factor [Planctomycetales bacterium]|nr:sigma-70 family RNA polymerase sigma factor [Planctomycetales bacterium]
MSEGEHIGGSMDTDDTQDVAAALAGDELAYRRLVERYQDAIGAQMHRFSRDISVRNELTHDVFVEAYFSLRTYRQSAPFLHWLRKIAVRIGYRFWTQNKANDKETALSEHDWQQLQGAQPTPGDTSDAAELVHALLARLPPADRLVLTLIYLDGCTMAEAADRAGWTVANTKVQAFRARNRLRKLLEGDSP